MKREDRELSMHLKDDDKRLFEGWYIKITDPKISLAIIIGISKTIEESYAFIQTLDTYTNQSQMLEYPLEAFTWGNEPFYLQLGDNLFTKDKVVLKLDEGSVFIQGTINLGPLTKLTTSLYAPTIMGPFAYLAKRVCNHGIISLKHDVNGTININGETLSINGIGYLEKDWGQSFPASYLWLQSNVCKEHDANIFLSVADVALMKCSFKGVIMTLLVEQQQYHLASYYGAYVKDKFIKEGYYYLIIKQWAYTFYFKIKPGNSVLLKAPQFGKMSESVEECLDALIVLLVYKHNQRVAKFSFTNCGLELFGDLFD